MSAPGLPPLTLTAGPSTAAADGRSASGGSTGAFYFKGKSTNALDVVNSVAPFLIMGGLVWLYLRRK